MRGWRAVAEKQTHFGRAGEYFAMSELLLRGWNVAVPVVDVGDDVFVIDDNDKTTRRLQVKSATTELVSEAEGGGVRARFKLSRAQLRTEQPIELIFMFLVRHEEKWRFLVIPRRDLLRVRDAFVEQGKERMGRGRRPSSDADATTDSVLLDVVFKDEGAQGWGASLTPYLDSWPKELPVVSDGPGAKARAEPQNA
jgi:hypothetical protein